MRSLISFTASVALLLPLAGAASATPEPSRRPDPVTFGSNRLASAVVIAGDQILLGRPGPSVREDAPMGGVHVFRRDGGGAWVEASVFAPKDIARDDDFGAALAVDGSWLAVGAPGAAEGRGAVYLFERNAEGRWVERAKLTAAAGTPKARLGESLALRGGLLIAGSPSYASGRGQAVVFRRAADGRWAEQATLQAPDSAHKHRFGRVIVISDGYLLVSAPGLVGSRVDEKLAGQVVVFRDSSSRWVEVERLTATGALGFGAAIVLDGATLWVGSPMTQDAAGAVHRFTRGADGRWTAAGEIRAGTPQPSAFFGLELARADKDLVVGAPGANRFVGAIYIMRANGESWSEAQRLTVPDAAPGFLLGQYLAASGNLVVAGAPRAGSGEGAGVIFHLPSPGGQWQTTATVVDTAWNITRSWTGAEVKCDDGRANLIFSCQQVDLLSFLPLSAIGGTKQTKASDIWGWTDSTSNREFALVGRSDGTSFVDVTDPVNPKYLGDLPLHAGARPSSWRDIKVYQNHAFIVADGAGAHGMQVFDLTQLRNVAQPPAAFTETAHYANVASVHNIAIDEATGFAYLVGTSSGGETCGGGLHMVDIRSPTKPAFVGCYAEARTGRSGTGYIHDTQCTIYQGPDADYRGKEICFNAAETAVSIADVSDKKSPKTISIAAYPNVGYTHQGWLSEDQRYFFLGDELDEGAMARRVGADSVRTRTIVFDLKDLDDPVMLAEFFGSTSATDHNLYVRGPYVYQSAYLAGLRVLDVTDPQHPKEVGYFDTVPSGENTPAMSGSWSNYPYFKKNGIVAVSSTGEGLYLVRYTPTGKSQ